MAASTNTSGFFSGAVLSFSMALSTSPCARHDGRKCEIEPTFGPAMRGLEGGFELAFGGSRVFAFFRETAEHPVTLGRSDL